jgi:TRAP-type mannitol/chloroaromatic compound transport system permease small subunit
MAAPPKALVRIVRVIDTVIGEWSGRLFAWLIIPLVGALVYEVFARYLFGAPTIWAYDVTYMLFGAHFMLGAAYTLAKGGHIRTDFFFSNWSLRTQGRIDAVGYLVFFFPGMTFFLQAGWDEALFSWQILEKSSVSPWQPPMYPFKTVIPATAAMLLIQGVSELIKSVWQARHGTRFQP